MGTNSPTLVMPLQQPGASPPRVSSIQYPVSTPIESSRSDKMYLGHYLNHHYKDCHCLWWEVDKDFEQVKVGRGALLFVGYSTKPNVVLEVEIANASTSWVGIWSWVIVRQALFWVQSNDRQRFEVHGNNIMTRIGTFNVGDTSFKDPQSIDWLCEVHHGLWELSKLTEVHM